MNVPSILTASVAATLAVSWATTLTRADERPPVNFVRDVRPILARHCFACHGPDEAHREADLRLDTRDGALAERDGHAAVAPGRPDASELIRRVTSADPDVRMPPPDANNPLTAEQIDILRRWIAQGAPWQSHWAFEKLTRPDVPQGTPGVWNRNPIDAFVLARLHREGLRPQADADRRTLARRVALDLTGLPPPQDLFQSFLGDNRSDAYERYVDALLRLPSYGERWAGVWLDLARYADTKGYEKDRSRTIWRYRDWVIDAFNRDLPYDRFTVEQLAGDLLPEPSVDQLLATAFHRNTMVNEEGGTDDEEFRVAAVKDRVDTTVQVWMGLTMGCGKCHSHKYDPISQREYYQFYAFFNQTEDSDKGDDRPMLATPTREQQARLDELRNEVARLETQLRELEPQLETPAAEWEKSLADVRGWRTLAPQRLEAASGSKLVKQDDGSILADASQPARETYTVESPLDATRLTGVRLEALPDKSQPRGGVGRSKDDGNFVLSAFRVQLRKPGGELIDVPLSRAEADFAQDNYPVAHVLNNPNPAKNGWAVSPRQAEPHRAVFALDKPLDVEPGSALVVTLDHRFEFSYPGFSLGRFRLSATGDERVSLESSAPDDILAIVRTPRDTRTDVQRKQLLQYYSTIAPLARPLRDRLARRQSELAAIRPPLTPILRELPADKRRVTKIHIRGNFLESGDAVEPAIPASFSGWNDDLPRNRLGVARWLTSDDNPLTARVAVNRHWAQFFGVGLVETQEDFGAQGQPPSHPELLDWLASEFRSPTTPGARPWSFKSLCRLIVLSSTYRKDSTATAELWARDRANRLLARGPRFRLNAEMVRDASLEVAGLLCSKMYGPSVMPPQPDGIWRSTYNTDKWITSAGEDRYRRGLYTFLKRTSPYPSMTTFDSPSREICTIRRIATNTPLQALVTLNDPVYVECAQALARRAIDEARRLENAATAPADEAVATDVARAVGWAFERAVMRPATGDEVQVLVKLYERRRDEFRGDVEAARRFATEPLGPLPPGADAVHLAAMTAVCNVILNLDEFLTRG